MTNNLKILRDFFQLTAGTVSVGVGLTIDELKAIEQGATMPEIAVWQRFAEFYAEHFHVTALPDMVEPIHFRLSVDYLMNIGVTLNDLLAFQWYFSNTRPEIGDFGVALFSLDEHPTVERITTNLADVLDQYAGYILLNNDGTLNQFIDERHDNKVSDWRLVLYKSDSRLIDVTADLIYFEHLVNFSLM